MGLDNAYTGPQLLADWKKQKLNGIGTVKLNRVNGFIKIDDKKVPVITLGENRGDFTHAVARHPHTDVNLLLVSYLDNKIVHFLSNYHAHPTVEDCDYMDRWFKATKEYAAVKRPRIKKVSSF